MRFYMIQEKDGDDTRAVGVMIEAEGGGIIGAALEGEADQPGSPRAVIETLLGQGDISETRRDGSQVRRVTVGRDQPGYVGALVRKLRPPLMPGPEGLVTTPGSPTDMLTRAWGFVPGTPIPPLVNL